jgi:hypothetical protein
VLSLSERVLALADAFAAAAIPYAFGGAIALAYYAQPRATSDIDLNVFLRETESAPVLRVLAGLGAAFDTEQMRRLIERDGQARIPWDQTPVDLFFVTIPFLESAASRVQRVRFNGREILILSAEDLAICKVAFNREKDWLDLREMAGQRGPSLDHAYIRRWLVELLGEDDTRLNRLSRLLADE